VAQVAAAEARKAALEMQVSATLALAVSCSVQSSRHCPLSAICTAGFAAVATASDTFLCSEIDVHHPCMFFAICSVTVGKAEGAAVQQELSDLGACCSSWRRGGPAGPGTR